MFSPISPASGRSEPRLRGALDEPPPPTFRGLFLPRCRDRRRRSLHPLHRLLGDLMRRPRPHIPLAVRVEVAERDVEKGLWWALYCSAVEAGKITLGRRLAILLGHLPKGAQLD